MRYVFVILIFALLIPFVLSKNIVKESIQNQTINEPSTPHSKLKEIGHKYKQYRYGIFTLDENQQLSFNLNTRDKKTSEEIISTEKCKSLINGGFYDKEGDPIGWVVVNSDEMYPSQKNQLLDGFISASQSGELKISKNKSLNFDFGLQTGPILIYEGGVKNLKIKNDEPKRRSIVLESTNNKPYFLTIVSGDSLFEGSLLKDLPQLVAKIANQEDISIINAINLDGGSASAFYSQENKISEIQTIGSYFCIK
ncbi:phosphodiester glycosidase family protein [Patescibacteria group bacterium]